MRTCPSGIITAVPTPFGGNAIDVTALERHIEWQVREGCGCLAFGTVTGEAPTLTPKERRALIRAGVEIVGGRVLVLAGIVGSSTTACREAAADAESAGADALVVATPAYNKPTQDGLVRHFEEVAGATALPIIIQDEPGRSVVELRPRTANTLLSNASIDGVIVGGDPGRISSFLELTGGRLALFGATDSTALAAALAGAEGHLSIVANVEPRLCTLFQSACDEANWNMAAQFHRSLRPLAQALEREPDPAPVKFALSRSRPGFPAEVRLPMLPVTASTAEAVLETLRTLASQPRPPSSDTPSSVEG